ncbi:cortical protein KAR9-domain-containing protein [Thelonectria olida]|uniref:Cortical protein KAR9-domain-containing protein n=1 Tax=Thelonectria olida TaxID=1576542 RepID=A0A9P9AYB8_9HYPO|nr:cortical protein KAR9-domain-containing protein [Thelonectria olida]
MSARLSISTTDAVGPVTAFDLSQHSDSEDSSIPNTPCSIDNTAERFSTIDAAPTTAVDLGVGLSNGLHQRDQDYDAPAGLLKFADVPSQLSHLPFTPGSTDHSSTRAPEPNPNSSSTTTATTFLTTTPSAASTATPTPANSAASISSNNTIATTDASQPSSPLPALALRKTSPGLAARLKALGFGSSKSTSASTTPQFDHIGRLDEDQLRQLDEKHQAGSITSIIARRGRPWKGVYPPSKEAAAELGIDIPPIKADDTSPIASLLPEIETPDPLDMDTYKYRLPDHTNGNGTKVTLDTRREHLERSTAPPTPDEAAVPPPPPPKDTPPATTPAPTTPPTDFQPNLNTYFTPSHTRPGSIYTLSRVSFANQLAQLTSLQIPDADSLATQVAAIPTAQVAAKALINAADQIRSWIYKASEVVDGLDSEDDVEWAAAGGREGLAEVENAIARFEGLVNAYVCAIEQLQNREDISNVPLADLNQAVAQMEAVIKEWEKIRRTLQIVRGQVEIAMEWEELWNNVLGDIQGEMDELSRLVFEMEERRHKSLMAAASGDSVDIGDLETIVEETPPQATRLQAGSRYSLPPAFPVSPSSPGTPTLSQDDSSLLALFARMQPLRASLDFLPMRLAVFETRAERSFPTACDELMMRHDGLDATYKKLEKDAESLRKELGEDRWVLVFRGAGRQAQKMHESVERSLLKLKEAVESGLHLTNQPAMTKKLESYEAKKTHYGPAIERVLAIIDKGVSDRLTVNGEILRLHTDMQARWEALKFQMREAEAMVEDMQAERSQQLRDSVSSMLSNDVSTAGSGRETPGSSPPSSVIMSSLGLEPYTPTSKPTKARATGGPKARPIPTNRRHSSLPAPTSHLGRKPGFSRLSTVAHSSPNLPASQLRRPSSTADHRPRWNASTNTKNVDTGHNFKPLTLTTPSPYAKTSPATQRSVGSATPGSASRLPTLRGPMTRAASESPRVSPRVGVSPRTERVDDTPTRTGHSRLSFRERLASPGPYSQQTLAKPRLLTQASTGVLETGRRSSLQASRPSAAEMELRANRPASSLASSSRRSSLLPPGMAKEGETGRNSPQALAGARTAMRKAASAEPKDNKPRWRH